MDKIRHRGLIIQSSVDDLVKMPDGYTAKGHTGELSMVDPGCSDLTPTSELPHRSRMGGEGNSSGESCWAEFVSGVVSDGRSAGTRSLSRLTIL